jgi:signal transduction histidine kinase
MAGVIGTLSEAFISGNQYDSALIYARESLAIARQTKTDDLLLVWNLNDLSQIFLATNLFDSSKYYAHKAREISATIGFKDQLQRAYEYLSRSFDKTDTPDSAFKYLQLAVTVKDSLYNSEKTKTVQRIVAREQTRLQEIEKERLNFQNKTRMYGLISGLLILGAIVFLLYRNNRQKQKANFHLQEQKGKIEVALQELKLTQQQLVQSEKMASLGELTAGIAHEIQNPLNFVNNFSEVSNELIDEMKTEFNKGDTKEAFVIADDIKQNLEKILHHGKRADAIVKGMLQHSQSSKSQKEPTDINALADEYLRLAYHGLRAKNKSFNAILKTDFDDTIGNINIIPQDIGRVILNLITNAFYAVNEKMNQGLEDYEPTVTVKTLKIPPSGGGGTAISVTDNGTGIPQNIIDRIFQPFFTTKPTGQGTGLGLSLAYEIIKAHGGELKVETEDGKGSEFMIQIPIN